jgi:hypothetical protein
MASPWEYNHVRTPKPQSGRPYSLANQVRAAPLGLGRYAESIPRTTSGAIKGLARWADFEFSTYAEPARQAPPDEITARLIIEISTESFTVHPV